MAVAEAARRGDGAADRVDEIGRPLERGLLPAADDRAGDLAREALLAEAAEDVGELALVRLVDEVAGRDGLGRVHAHVERGVDRVGEAALGPVDLHARDAEVEEDRVDLEAVLGELAEDDGEVAAQEPRAGAALAAEAVEVGARVRVAVDGDEASAPARGRRRAGARGRPRRRSRR